MREQSTVSTYQDNRVTRTRRTDRIVNCRYVRPCSFSTSSQLTDQEWRELMTQCLVLACQSPPDVAYAVEYTTSICGRAGVKVQLELPDNYLRTADGAYFR